MIDIKDISVRGYDRCA